MWSPSSARIVTRPLRRRFEEGRLDCRVCGKLVARSDAVTALDTSTPPKRLAIFSFESADKARAWLRSDAMKESEAARAKLTKSGVYMVEGMAN